MSDDHFGDLDLGSLGLGALSGIGADDHYATRSSMHPSGEGMQFELKCDPCGARQHIIVSWDELIFVSEGVPPPGTAASPPWAYSKRHGSLHPNMPCCSCGRQDTLCMLTPDEATRHLKAAVQAGRATPQYIASAQQQVRAMGARYRQ